jgi:hypothetical protein
MKAIIDQMKLTLDDLLEVRIGMQKHEDQFDARDFCGNNLLYQLYNEVHELVNDIFFKLLPEELDCGSQTLFTAWGNVFDAGNHPKLMEALYLHFNPKRIDQDLYKLRQLADNALDRYQGLLAA